MSAVTPTEIERFREFLNARLASGDASLTLDAALEMFREGDTGEVQKKSNGEVSQPVVWNDAKARRRSSLVDKEIKGMLSAGERNELETLQAELRAYRQKVAPLPLDDLREVHDELLRKVEGQLGS